MGVQSFSSPEGFVKYVIFAANKHYVNHVNGYLTSLGIGFKPLVGSYKGKTENSWIVKQSDFSKVSHLLDGEESILILGNMNSLSQRQATLHFLADASEISLGWFMEVEKHVAYAAEGYTQDFYLDANGKCASHYWICM